METRLTVVGLFAGVGAFSLGFLKANEDAAKFRFDLRLLVDSDPVDGHRQLEATTVNGPWSTSPNQNNPQVVPGSAGQRFYRLRQ